ncbi:hypothetical protein FQZ97_1049830 [compost metagenome]
MGQAGALGGEEQRAVDHAAGVGRAQVGFDQVALEGVALGGLLEMHALEAAQLGADPLQLAAGSQLEFEALSDLETAELFGVLAAVQDVVQVVAGQADLGEHRRQRVAITHGHSLEAGIGRFLDGGEIGRLVFLLIRVFFGAVLVFGWVLDLGEWRDTLIPVD